MSIYPILGITRILLNKELRIFVVYSKLTIETLEEHVIYVQR